MFAWPALLHCQIQTLLGDPHEFQPHLVRATDRNGGCGVADKAVESHATVDRKNVAILQLIFRGEAMNHLLVNGGTNRIWKSVVTLECRKGASVANHLLCGAIDLNRGDTG